MSTRTFKQLPPLPRAGKEYAKADSRYITRDDFVISMEAVTAFIEGPGCLAIVGGLLAGSAWRHVAVLLVSLGQLYGDVLYFGTCLHGGVCLWVCMCVCVRAQARLCSCLLAEGVGCASPGEGAGICRAQGVVPQLPAVAVNGPQAAGMAGVPLRNAAAAPHHPAVCTDDVMVQALHVFDVLPPAPPPLPGITRHTRPEPLYFWFYFVIINGIWIVVPTACIVHAAVRINAAVAWWVACDRCHEMPLPFHQRMRCKSTLSAHRAQLFPAARAAHHMTAAQPDCLL
jgi:EXPERA (EXPanded EBP superfamily)